jgi:transcriptional regulator with XRE-family HTH domain
MAKHVRDELHVTSAGEAIRSLRLQAGLSLNDLAGRLGWDKGRLSKIENGHLALTLSVIEKIAEALDQSPLSIVVACLRERYPDLASRNSKAGRILDDLTRELSR